MLVGSPQRIAPPRLPRSRTDASVEPLRAQFVILIRERPLRAPLVGHVVLLGGELLFPFDVALDDLAE